METSVDAPQKKFIQDAVCDRIIQVTRELIEQYGAHRVTVKMVIKEMGVTNRVFYNRYPNIDTVLIEIYNDLVMTMRTCLYSEIDKNTHFRDFCMDIAQKVLSYTYDIQKNFCQYHFEHDSLSIENATWWITNMKAMLNEAMENGFIKHCNAQMLAYSFWCFCRGYSADSVARGLDRELAVEGFTFAMSCYLDGIKCVNATDLERA